MKLQLNIVSYLPTFRDSDVLELASYKNIHPSLITGCESLYEHGVYSDHWGPRPEALNKYEDVSHLPNTSAVPLWSGLPPSNTIILKSINAPNSVEYFSLQPQE